MVCIYDGEESKGLTWSDLGKIFHLGSVNAHWRVAEIIDNETTLCQMAGTEDYIVLPNDVVRELLDEFDEYYAELYCR